MSPAAPTAFVLAGGGSLGAIQVGMLRALIAAGERPDFVVGTSVGAINAAYFASDPTPEGVARLSQLWTGLRRRDVFPVDPLAVARGIMGQRDHLFGARALRRLVESHFAAARLETLPLPCFVVASDLRDGAEVVLRDGPVVDALLASTAIPVVFPPVRVGDRMLVDGAIANNAPISTALALGARRVIVLPTGFACAAEPPRGAIGMVLHTMTLLVARQLAGDVGWLAGTGEIAIVPPLCPLPVSAYDFSQAAALEARAAQETAAWIAEGGLGAHAFPRTLRPHAHVAMGGAPAR